MLEVVQPVGIAGICHKIVVQLDHPVNKQNNNILLIEKRKKKNGKLFN